MSRRSLGFVAGLLLASLLGVAGYLLLFTSFKTYDDEGYVLISLAHFAHGGRLYGEVYSQYGPFFFWWNDAWHRLFGFAFTNTTGRFVTLVYWLGAALLVARLVARQTRATAWALLALAATFSQLWQMTAEPMHPGGLIVFLVALGAWAGGECLGHGRVRTLAAVVGAIGAALALTKINLGVFFFAGAGAWLWLNSTKPGRRRLAPWFVGAALALLPWALMKSLLGEAWVIEFAVVIACASLGTMLAALPSTRGWFSDTGWRWLVGTALAVALLVAGLTLARGTTLRELADGIVLGPLRHPGAFSFAVNWRPGALLLAVVSLAACTVVHLRGWGERTEFVTVAIFVRLILLALAIGSWFAWLPLNCVSLALSYGLSLVWLLVIPLGRDAAALEASRVRAWLGLLAVLQALHAYPVGGSQLGWGTFLWAPLLVLASAEAVARIGQRARVASWLAVAAAFGLASAFAFTGWQRWHTSEPLRLPGADELHLPDLMSARLRAFTLNATVHADTLFSLPGIFSFNLWSGRPTPTSADITHWFNLLSPAQQRAIESRLAADPRAMVVVERDLVRFIRAGGIPVEGPLHDYLVRDFAPALSAGNYELWCKRGRTIARLSTAHLYVREGATEKYQLDVTVFTPPGARIASVEWFDCSDEEHTRSRFVLDATNCRLEVTPLLPNGHPGGPTTAAPLPATVPQFARLAFISNAPLAALPRRAGVLRLRDSDGALVAEAIFID